jgi:DNA-binding response OmpR family regulator
MFGSLVLIAEDERDIREFLAVALQVSGFNVIEARNGEEAVALANSQRPDLILLDIRMPKVTGFEACEILKANPDTRNIPIVFLSAFAHKDEVQRGLQIGAEEYLTKPIAPDVLTQRVSVLLERFKLMPDKVKVPLWA